MKNIITIAVLAASAVTNAFPQPLDSQYTRDLASIEAREPSEFTDALPESEQLWKRKGGGGGGGKGSGSSSSSYSSSSSGGSSSSSSGSRGGSGSSSSSAGGRTTTGSGVKPAYGGGRYYGGGAAVPYTAGGRSASGIVPFLFVGTAFAVFPALWLYSVYSYPYIHPYSFRNITANINQTKPIQCLCEQYSVCGCDENGDTTYLTDLIGNGSYAALNKTLVAVADINGTSTILINGSLPNGTTAAGGTESADAGVMLKASGYWVMAALVGCTVLLT